MGGPEGWEPEKWAEGWVPERWRRRTEPLDDSMYEGDTSFESVAQCARTHTVLPLQAEPTKLPLSGRGQAVTVHWVT